LPDLPFTPDKYTVLEISAVVLLFAFWLSNIYWRSKIRKWAQSENCRLITYRQAWFYEGPSKFMRSRNQHTFRVEVEDRHGLRRVAWLEFGTFWGFTWGEPLTGVRWVDDDAI